MGARLRDGSAGLAGSNHATADKPPGGCPARPEVDPYGGVASGFGRRPGRRASGADPVPGTLAPPALARQVGHPPRGWGRAGRGAGEPARSGGAARLGPVGPGARGLRGRDHGRRRERRRITRVGRFA
ncbi:hypothetical protein GCM10010274_22190 [Streptomyces lavendofoliae]|uniref:Uncharacterized protein n=1 Tax=Streptomyces lavendofoliae TaxID=67314 RepID=A0A918HXP8_9ACTN|nr:hypothetical protein GCM10010274_22190 [Streptomyces lavendofoliae]